MDDWANGLVTRTLIFKEWVKMCGDVLQAGDGENMQMKPLTFDTSTVQSTKL